MTTFGRDLYVFIRENKALNPSTTPKEMRNLLCNEFGDFDSPVWNHLEFGFAHWLDKEFFGTGGGYWAHSYGFPEEGTDWAENVGIFTFDTNNPLVDGISGDSTEDDC